MLTEFAHIAHIHTPYKEKFAVPRQPGLVTAAKGQVHLIGEYNQPELVRDIEQFSHLWLLFVFHKTAENGWQPLVRPPRLGGNRKTGVLATRATHRPNPIGMSVVKLDKIEQLSSQTIIHVSGVDLVDQTPIIDIKPYIPYVDALPDATAGFAQHSPNNKLAIVFNDRTIEELKQAASQFPNLSTLIEQVLSQDPRPAYHQDEREYGMHLYGFNIRWKVIDSTCHVLSIATI